MAMAPDPASIAAEAAVMARIAVGDQAALARVMAAETPRLLRLTASMLDATSEGEDVVQEAFLRLWNVAPDWEPRARIGTWLHQVVYRLSIDVIRKRRPMVDMEDVGASLPDPADTPEDAALESERDRMVAAVLAQLPERQRSAIVLAHYQGLAQAEAAAVLELTEEAYESLLARGRRRLKELVARAMDEAGKDG